VTVIDLRRARVLVVGAATPATDMVAEELAAANFEILRCVEPGRPAFPCAGLRRGSCPLDVERPVDVAVAVRTRAHPRPRLAELGALCALRDRIPLVIAGTSVLNPFEPWAAETVDLHNVVPAVKRQLPPPDTKPAADAGSPHGQSGAQGQLGPHRSLPLHV
jgi:hypothetical protein